MSHYQRQFESEISSRLQEKPSFIQVILGPRQVGKTSGILHILEKKFDPSDYSYVSCEDELHNPDWFLKHVQKTAEEQKKILVFDEIQKLENWSQLIKSVWDQKKRQKQMVHIVLLGSSSLELTLGLNESLAGRFETIPVHHWSAQESRLAYKLDFEDYLRYGGYPGSYPLRSQPTRFRKYVMDSIFENVVTRDIMSFSTIKKPALFRQTFALACQYPAQEVSYNKLLGQLQDAGNVDQIKHYLDLFSQAFLLRLIFKYGKTPLSRNSSPKILPCAPVFTTLLRQEPLSPEDKGRQFESIVGNRLCETFESVYYWRDGFFEVDFVVRDGKTLIGIEVKSKTRKSSGIEAFKKMNPKANFCYIDFENYLSFEKDPTKFLRSYATPGVW
jgi:predicted AAA+ superfamily ATPase